MEPKDLEGLYNGGDAEKGPSAVAELAADCERAAQSATTTRKHMKQTEIALRKIESRLETLRKA